MTVISTRRFLAGTAALFIGIIAAVWIWAVNGRMWFLDPEYPVWVAKTQMIRSCAHGETTILGDSRPLSGLIPDRMGDGVMNLALGGGSPIETAYLVKHLLKCPSRPKRVIISFGPAILMRAEVYWGRAALFGFLTFQQMEEVRLISQRLGDRSIYYNARGPSHLNDILENYYYRIGLPSHYFPAMLSAWFVTRKRRNFSVLEATLRDRGYVLFGNAARADWASPEARIREFQPAPLLDYYFGRIISVLREHKVPAYFVSMPINEATDRAMDPDLRQEFATYLDEIRKQNTNFHILGDLLPALPAENFSDPEHLNQAGAMVWSDYVAKQISDLIAADSTSGESGL